MLLNQNSDFHNAQINTVIDSKKSISELIPILHAINMDPDVLKNVIKQTVNQFDSSVCRRVFYSLLNIEQILPEDVIQKIESFNHSLSMKSVSKTFKRCFTKNENIKLKEREVEIATELNVTENNQTWVIDSELADHDACATSALHDALNQAMAGDTILMHDGTYILNDDHEFNKDIQLVGIGDNVIIEFPQNESLHSVCCKLYLKNLKLYMHDLADGIQVEQDSSLWMEKCVIHITFYGVAVSENANLCAANCIFEGPSDYQAIDIKKPTNTSRLRRRKISILNCRFTDCGSKSGESCITIPEWGYWSLTVIGNSFKNMKGFPIGFNMADMADSHDYKVYPPCPFIVKNSAIFRLNQLSFKDKGLFRYLS